LLLAKDYRIAIIGADGPSQPERRFEMGRLLITIVTLLALAALALATGAGVAG
jgi:hypothetical protein